MLCWQELVRLCDDDLGRLDMAEVNLSCAQGLCDADADECLQALDRWADCTRRETECRRHDYEANPRDYENSWSYFRLLVMYMMLWKCFGARYNANLIDRDDWLNNPDFLFIHAVTQKKAGTCASLPPVVAAVAGMLGYPLTLVAGKCHLFARWEDPQERFNIECTSPGRNVYPHEHYRRWPEDSEDIERSQILKSMTPREELALFLSDRGHVRWDRGQRRQAVDVLAWSSACAPENKIYYGWLVNATRRWCTQLIDDRRGNNTWWRLL